MVTTTISLKSARALINTAIIMMAVFGLAGHARAAAIIDGDLIKTATHENVYIVKIVGAKKFKRLILNPDIFNQYAHLKWENIKTVTEAVFGAYKLSYIVREIDDQAVYQLEPDEDTGTKRLVHMTPSQFEVAGFDWDAIYIINQHERDAYANGQDLTPANLPPRDFQKGIIPGISSTKDIDTLERLGVQIVRITPKDLSFTETDLESRDIGIMVQVVDQRGSSPGVPPPSDINAWVANLKTIVRQHPKVTYWQVWNEPNEVLYWYPQPNAAAYVALLKKSYVAIKEANPRAVVIMGGLSGINPTRQYLRDMYAAGARNYFDVLALHPYHQPNSPDTFLDGYLRFMKNIMEAWGDLDTPIWITEIGWPTDPNQFGAVSPDSQAAYLTRTYDIAHQLDFVKKVFWYRLQDAGEGMGILGKPAEQAYQGVRTD